ncbi:FAD-binding oxidoreductase [Demequina sp. SYSU T00039]|uniref:FAD-binding oxidoreductase n=1 Tax=Demequina lignilytica TaxID=3051663 RepID=A0AAW7M1I4_9MICO|nr:MULTISPECIES: FAD-binding oxidoreductase [unclassified Demequina]MDN4478062.1 FAD-binding oxidoreductase [Demequina sp. SYSU T00039-1]MDN4488488.1 FAD-binding oxidoreductase [Demequina sp. SYSU T00039]
MTPSNAAGTLAPSHPRRSLWLATLDEPLAPSDPLTGDTEADVAIVGAGFTGLWTALYLARARPDLRIVVLERYHAGFGASGRNGGWASALFPSSFSTLAREHGPEAAMRQHAAMRASVDELLRVAAEEGIDAGAAKGGTIVLARTPVQLARARAEVEEARRWGRAEDDLVLLGEDDARARLDGAGTLGATYTPDCAAIHPGRLVRGLLAAVRRRGVRVHEATAVTAIAPRRVTTPRGTVRARHIVRATEGYTPGLPGSRRAVIPVQSLVLATEPLPAEVWERIGLAGRETFSDHRHLIVYGQRTADDRLVFGGRGAPYRWGSSTALRQRAADRVHAALRATVAEMLPALEGVPFPYAWGGALGIARDWHASVGFDARTGIGWAGGYVGDGVTTTNLAGRTLRDLILGEDTALTTLPWVGHRSRRWEPEPLRWAGANAGLRAMAIADREERITGRESLVARAMSPLMGGH